MQSFDKTRMRIYKYLSVEIYHHCILMCSHAHALEEYAYRQGQDRLVHQMLTVPITINPEKACCGIPTRVHPHLPGLMLNEYTTWVAARLGHRVEVITEAQCVIQCGGWLMPIFYQGSLAYCSPTIRAMRKQSRDVCIIDQFPWNVIRSQECDYGSFRVCVLVFNNHLDISCRSRKAGKQNEVFRTPHNTSSCSSPTTICSCSGFKYSHPSSCTTLVATFPTFLLGKQCALLTAMPMTCTRSLLTFH